MIEDGSDSFGDDHVEEEVDFFDLQDDIHDRNLRIYLLPLLFSCIILTFQGLSAPRQAFIKARNTAWRLHAGIIILGRFRIANEPKALPITKKLTGPSADQSCPDNISL